MDRQEIPGYNLPKPALALISRRQRSYLDEFVFFQLPYGYIEGWYAGELLALWNGKSWQEPTFVFPALYLSHPVTQ